MPKFLYLATLEIEKIKKKADDIQIEYVEVIALEKQEIRYIPYLLALNCIFMLERSAYVILKNCVLFCCLSFLQLRHHRLIS